jgi:alpha-glucoside transport system permease protein
MLVMGLFLAPALILLGVLVVYPIFFTAYRSLWDAPGTTFVGAENYGTVFTSDATFTAIRNNIIWVVFAPTLATAIGLVFAVLTERVSWSTAFKIAVFMPMAVSFLAAGVIWRLVYELDPQIGLANAVTRSVVDVFRSPGDYPGARPQDDSGLEATGRSFTTTDTYTPGDTALLPLIAIPPPLLPEDEVQAAEPESAGGEEISGTVWFDFTRGGGGEANALDEGETGLPNVKVEAVQDGSVVASDTTSDDGVFVLEGLSSGGEYQLRLADSNFREAYGGISWLGATLITPAMIVSFLWIWAGFAMVVIAAGLAAIPREALEAARVDGASEWQVFRRVTVPLLMPVLIVVFFTLAINVLKIFDLVWVIPPGGSAAAANVVAVEMWRVSFGGGQDQGLGSALAVLLFLMVVPGVVFNIRRFRAEQR